MEQLKIVLKRLRRPSVIISIVSQVTAFLVLFNVNIDKSVIMSAATIVCSILTTMGILSNPDSQKNGYGDDIINCESCGGSKLHVNAGDQMICADCGAIHDSSNKLDM